MYGFPEQWQSERLLIQKSNIAEAARLRDIFNSCAYVGDAGWDPTFTIIDSEEMVGHILKGNQTDPTAKRQFHIFTIRDQQTSTIVGYFHLYLGNPEVGLVLLSMMVIDKQFQGQSYGRELVESLLAQLEAINSLTAMRLEVYLNNWPALRFWFAHGFTKILEIDGDKLQTPNAHSSLVLERSL